ncbi:MAG TPA: hypothetical protein P5556_05990 [Candidatus Gastranaerophilales bacterium]|nr:hypothetical protein [Candidatus Gastranaerophilales bacterium]
MLNMINLLNNSPQNLSPAFKGGNKETHVILNEKDAVNEINAMKNMLPGLRIKEKNEDFITFTNYNTYLRVLPSNKSAYLYKKEDLDSSITETRVIPETQKENKAFEEFLAEIEKKTSNK